MKLKDLLGLIPYAVLIGICWGIYKLICFFTCFCGKLIVYL